MGQQEQKKQETDIIQSSTSFENSTKEEDTTTTTTKTNSESHYQGYNIFKMNMFHAQQQQQQQQQQLKKDYLSQEDVIEYDIILQVRTISLSSIHVQNPILSSFFTHMNLIHKNKNK